MEKLTLPETVGIPFGGINRKGKIVVTSERIKTRLAWAEISEEEAAARLGVAIARELTEIPEDDPERKTKAIRRAARSLWVTAWQAGCLAAMGADALTEVIPS